jgi:hypothetical protein
MLEMNIGYDRQKPAYMMDWMLRMCAEQMRIIRRTSEYRVPQGSAAA